jgi:hypothetical protein
MAPLSQPELVLPFLSILLLLLFDLETALNMVLEYPEVEEDDSFSVLMPTVCDDIQHDMTLVLALMLHCYRLLNSHSVLLEDFGFWVKPRSTAWFSRFMVDQYDNEHWIQHSRMTKVVVFRLAAMLSPHIAKKDTWYRLAIPAVVRVACTLFKLAQGASLTICSELFAVGVSTMSCLVYAMVSAINIELRPQIS